MSRGKRLMVDNGDPDLVRVPQRPSGFSRLLSYLTPLVITILLLWVGSATALGVAYWQARGELVKLSLENKELKQEVTNLTAMKAPKPTPIFTPSAEKLSSVFFPTASHFIKEKDKEELSNVVKWLKSNPRKSILMTGYADPRGSEEYNRVLGSRRAEEVKEHLVKAGVDSTRLITVSAGETLSIPIKKTFEKQRRVDLLVIGETAPT